MSAMSDYLEVELRKHVFRTGTFTKPSELWVALCTAATLDADTGSTITEPAALEGYLRAQLDPADANWSAPDGLGGLTANLAELSYTADGGDWGTITHVAICDADTAGNVLFHGELDSPKVVNDSDTLKFEVTELKVIFA
jgi:hypothetical protein